MKLSTLLITFLSISCPLWGQFSNHAFSFNLPTGEQQVSVTLFDVASNSNIYNDIIVLNAGDDTFSIFENDNGDISDTPVNFPTSEKAIHVIHADIDGDGKDDIITTDIDFFGTVSVYHNQSELGVIDANSFAENIDEEGAINGSLEIYNTIGEKIFQANLTGRNNVISTVDLPSGIYLASLKYNGLIKTKKIIKQ